MTGPNLRPYQETGRDWLAKRTRGILGDDPGLGKTGQVLTAAQKIRSMRTLIVPPAHLQSNWMKEIAKFWTGPYRAEIVDPARLHVQVKTEFPLFLIASYERASLSRHLLMQYGFSLMVCDEAHYLKNPESGRTRAVLGDLDDPLDRGVASIAERMWWMTGTPMLNDPSELWTAARSNGVTSLNYLDWKATFCETVWTPKYGDRIVGGKNMDLLKSGLSRIMLRRKKRDVLKDLPPLSIESLALDVDTQLLRELATMRRNLPTPPVGADDDEVLRWFAKNELHWAAYQHKCGLAKADSAALWIKDYITNGGGPLVVVARHLGVLDRLKEAIPGSMVVSGRISQRKRQDVVDMFQRGEVSTLLGQIAAMGTGYTMTAASTMLLLEPSPVPAENIQAIGRIDRFGQENPTTVYVAHAAGTSDEQTARAVRRKMRMLAGLNLE